MPIMMVLKALREMPIEQNSNNGTPQTPSLQGTPRTIPLAAGSENGVIRFFSNVNTPEADATEVLYDNRSQRPSSPGTNDGYRLEMEMESAGNRDEDELVEAGAASRSHAYRMDNIQVFDTDEEGEDDDKGDAYDEDVEDEYQNRYHNHHYAATPRSPVATFFSQGDVQNLLGLIEQANDDIHRANMDLGEIQDSLMRMDSAVDRSIEVDREHLARLASEFDNVDAYYEEYPDREME